jgi:hypothetical protein
VGRFSASGYCNVCRIASFREASGAHPVSSRIDEMVKMVVASALNEDGEQLFPRTWNRDFIDLPEIRSQRQPTFSEGVMKIIPVLLEEREASLAIERPQALAPSASGGGQPKAGAHAFRPFRTTWLRKQHTPEDLIRFWLGHANLNITDAYSKLHEDVAFRKKVAEQARSCSQLHPTRTVVNFRVRIMKVKRKNGSPARTRTSNISVNSRG